MTVLVDAGPLVAYFDRRDPHHDACAALIEEHAGPLLVPQLVITEVVHLIGDRMGAHVEVRFLANLDIGTLIPTPAEPADWERIIELVWRYRDVELGTVDASVVAIAERLGITRIATLDHRHFGLVRPNHVERFELLP